MLACAVVLVLSATAFVAVEIVSFRRNMVSHMYSLAEILSANSTVALTLKSKHIGDQIMSSLLAEPHICSAYLFDIHHQTISVFVRPDDGIGASGQWRTDADHVAYRQMAQVLKQGGRKHFFSRESLSVAVPVHQFGKIIGMVYIRSDLGAFYAWLRSFALSVLAVLAVTCLIGYLVARHLQHLISFPILHLADKMREVSLLEDFSLRVVKPSNDEVGVLFSGFNNMLEQLEIREQQLENYRYHLEEQVLNRTQELLATNEELQLTVEQLGQARHAAEAANQAKSRFLANMSHEIRTPMIGVISVAELLFKSPLTAEQRDLALMIHSSGESLLKVLNDILDFSKNEAGQLELEKIPFNLVDVVEEPLTLLATGAQEKNIELICRIDPGTPVSLLGDPARMRQILFNLLGNAVKFTADGEVVVRVGCRDENVSSALIYLEVKDTGIGIDASSQKGIFESFSQADSSTTRHYGGTGLGLAIVKQLLDLMGGHISLKSALHEGAVFTCTVRLPKHKDVRWPDGSMSHAHHGVSVLVVDPHPGVRDMLVEQIASLNLKVDAVASIDEACRCLSTSVQNGVAYRLVVVDSEIVRGNPALQQMTRNAALQDCRWIKMVPRICADGSRDSGMYSACLVKPICPSQLHTVVIKTLEPDNCGEIVPAAQETMPAEEEQSAKSPVRILLAEDNPTTRKMICISLKSRNYEVTAVENGQQAIDEGLKKCFDIILMDCQMPVMDGFQAVAALRKAGVKTPVVALTAHALGEAADFCRQTGMDDYLAKPFKHNQLYLLVDKWAANTTATPVVSKRDNSSDAMECYASKD